uniref:hypothetical protein n=1 Tax=Salmonella sp. TaxID=599 RepID=UPI001CD9AE8D|nr:hypothetical protein [Salmonella sp.]
MRWQANGIWMQLPRLLVLLQAQINCTALPVQTLFSQTDLASVGRDILAKTGVPCCYQYLGFGRNDKSGRNAVPATPD